MPKLGNKHFAYTPEGQAAYKAAKAAKPKKAGPISEDEKERAMGADAWVKDKVTKSGGFKVGSYSTLKDAQMGLADNISESDVGDYYPAPVWEKASNKFVARLWATHIKQQREMQNKRGVNYGK